MEWLNQWNKALDYIEQNLETKIDYEQAAKIACCSSFHFSRMFSYIANISLSEYVRNRRMTLAAFDLQSSDEKIIDIAYKYGYDSPTSFNRAFQSVHGIPPSKAKDNETILKAFPKITIQISVKGEAQMNYKIVKKEAFRIIGVSKHYKMNIEENFNEVPKFWQETTMSGKIPEIIALNNCAPYGLLGVSTCMNGKDFDYYISVASDKDIDDSMTEYIVPKSTWAIFECIGAMPNAIQDLQKRIITQWLPTSGYEYADAPDIEVYFEGDQFSENYKCEVWLPIRKK